MFRREGLEPGDLLRRGERMEASHFLRDHLDGARHRKAPEGAARATPRTQ